MFFLLGFITLAATIAQIVSFNRMFSYVQRELEFKPTNYAPKASVILPCKGLDPGFEENITKLLAQRYIGIDGKPGFEVIFAVAQENDPAYSVLQKICATEKSVQTKIVVAGINQSRAQKINNQLCALQQISDDSEVLVFVDSDVIARNDFIQYLIAHLQDHSVGVTTGYRFYIPFKGDWPSLLRSLWNRMSAWELADPNYAFAWGGAMATRRETFVEARVAEHWDRAADDDLSLTTAVKEIGLKVRFVPQCLVASHGDASIPEIVEWTNRQLILTKVYYPKLWRRAIRRAVILVVWLLALATSMVVAAITNSTELIAASVAGLILLPIEVLFLLKAQRLWYRVLSLSANEEEFNASDPAQKSSERALMEHAYQSSLLRFSLVLPLAHIVLPWMTLYSVLTNRIRWRGINYELRSPSEVVII
jgi:ceramide glucosyltransferase